MLDRSNNLYYRTNMSDGRLTRGSRTRASLVQAALEIIVLEGADAVTQRKVAARAGCSLASTTYHFPAAIDLLVAAFEAAAEASGDDYDRLSAQVQAGEKSVMDAAMIFAGRKPFGSGFAPDAIPQLYLAAAHLPALRPTGQAFLERLAAPLAVLTGSSDAALTLARCLTGLILHEMARGQERPSETLRGDVARLFSAFGVRDPDQATLHPGDQPDDRS